MNPTEFFPEVATCGVCGARAVPTGSPTGAFRNSTRALKGASVYRRYYGDVNGHRVMLEVPVREVREA